VNDKSLGSLIFVLGLAGAIGYLFWLFTPVVDTSNLLFYSPIGVRWAILVPIMIGVLALLIIAMWIGWTMFVTPAPPTILEKKPVEKADLEKEKKDSI
jgi:hypothetical protein